jgi:hypothetical protein
MAVRAYPDQQVTWCDTCRHVEAVSRKQSAYYWLCHKHPRIGGFGFVAPEAQTNSPPFLFCRHVNGGRCPLYEKQEVENVE